MKRYVAAMIRSAKTDEGLTEENFKVGSLRWKRAAVVMVIARWDPDKGLRIMTITKVKRATKQRESHRMFSPDKQKLYLCSNTINLLLFWSVSGGPAVRKP